MGAIFVMLESLLRNPEKRRRLGSRLVEGMREVGILFIAFAPLDSVVYPGSERGTGGWLLFFAGLGLLLFFGALVLEWRVDR